MENPRTERVHPATEEPAPAALDGGRLIRLLGGLALLAIAAITAIISYRHGLDVVRVVGTDGLVAFLLPLVADALIFGSSLALLDAAQRGMRRPWLAVASLTSGIVVTIAMNVADGWRFGVGGALVSAWAPVALVLSFHTLMGMVRGARQHADAVNVSHLWPEEVQCPHGVALSADEAIVTAFLHARDCLGDEPSQRQLATAYRVSRDKVAKLLDTLAAPGPDPAAAAELNGHGENQ